MSPSIALHDSVFRTYFVIVLISLVGGGLVLGFIRFGLKRETRTMFQTYWSWILIAGIGLIVVFLGRVPTIVGVTFRRHPDVGAVFQGRDRRFRGDDGHAILQAERGKTAGCFGRHGVSDAQTAGP